MKITITKNARRLLNVFAKEMKMQQDRVDGGHIKQADAERYLIERLVAIGKRDPSVQAFLTYVGPINSKDDDDDSKPWAKDPREGRRHVVSSRLPEGKLSPSKDFESDPPWPAPGERIA